MNDIVVIGGNEFNLGFRLAGVKSVIETDDSVEQQFKQAFENPKNGIIITDDKTLEKLSPHFKELVEASAKPSVVVLSLEGRDEGLRNMIVKAIGVDVWEK